MQITPRLSLRGDPFCAEIPPSAQHEREGKAHNENLVHMQDS